MEDRGSELCKVAPSGGISLSCRVGSCKDWLRSESSEVSRPCWLSSSVSSSTCNRKYRKCIYFVYLLNYIDINHIILLITYLLINTISTVEIFWRNLFIGADYILCITRTRVCFFWLSSISVEL